MHGVRFWPIPELNGLVPFGSAGSVRFLVSFYTVLWFVRLYVLLY